MRATIRDSKEIKQRHIQEQNGKIEGLNQNILKKLEDLKNILSHSLSINYKIKFDSLRIKEPFPPFKPDSKIANPHPPLSFFKRLIPGSKKRYNLLEAKRISELDTLKINYEISKISYEEKMNQQNIEIDKFELSYKEGYKNSIINYCLMVLERSEYPENFPKNYKIAYISESNEVVIDYELPKPDIVPHIQEYKYVKSIDAIKKIQKNKLEVDKFYQDIIFSIVIRTCYELFESDIGGYLSGIRFNGYIQTLGFFEETIKPFIVTVNTKKEQCQKNELNKIVKNEYLRKLGIQLCLSVTPMITTDRVDKVLKEGCSDQELYEAYKNEKPIFILENGEYKAQGLTQVTRFKKTNAYIGELKINQTSGNQILIKDVVNYVISIKNLSSGYTAFINKNKPIILKPFQLDDILLFCLKPNKIKNNFIITYTLYIYHNDQMLLKINNICNFHISKDSKRIFYDTKDDISIEQYKYWLCQNLKPIFIGEGKEANYNELQEERTANSNLFENSTYIFFYFHKTQSKSFYVVLEFSKTADIFEILENEFQDDDTINYKVGFLKSRLRDIAFIKYCISVHVLGYAVYNCTVDDFKKALFIGIKNIPNILKSIYENDTPYEYYQKILEHLYSKYDMPVDYSELPSQFKFGLYTVENQVSCISNFLNMKYDVYNNVNCFEEMDHYSNVHQKAIAKLKLLHSEFRIEYNNIYVSLVSKGIVMPKWQSEMNLYQLIKSQYDDAIYQYRVDWLGMQSLDVFIPSLKVAFEYQGAQHFKPIDFFGGKLKYDKQKQLDATKAMKCINNGVKLIEWPYTEPVNKIILKTKFQDLGQSSELIPQIN